MGHGITPLLLLLVTAPAGAQYGGSRSSTPAATTLIRPADTFRQSSAAYSTRNAILDQWRKEREERERKQRGEEPAPAKDPAGSSFRIPQGRTSIKPDTPQASQGSVFPQFHPRQAAPTVTAEPPAAGTAPDGATLAPAAPVPPPPRANPAPPAGLQGVKIRPIEEGVPSRFQIVAAQQQRLARQALEALAASPEPVDELGMVRRVLEAMGSRAPGSSEELVRAGFPVPPRSLEPGDLLFFELGAGRQRTRHVGVYYGEGSFSYATRQGVRTAALEEPRWSQRLVEARRLR